MPSPRLLRGATAIGERLGYSAKQADHMIRQHKLPTFQCGGVPHATAGALDEWRALYVAGKLPA